jgi:CheY-like chemotaxis protein
MDGDELVRNIRSPETTRNRDIPIIAMTANTGPGIREHFLENGYNDYIPKPMEAYQLNKLLERWVGSDKRRNKETLADISLCIKGLDENMGMAGCLHSREKYRELLYLYCSDMEYRLDLLRNTVKSKEKALQEQKTYITSNLHVIKSACMTIGANTYAKTAYDLEQGQGDMVQLSLFTEELASFREEILRNLPSA